MNILKRIFKKQVEIVNVDVMLKNNILNQRGNLDALYPSDFTATEISLIDSVIDYTMTSPERLVSLSRAVDYIEFNKIEGDVVECGVWKGGSMMLVAKKLLELNNSSRKLYLFDTYEGMTSPSDNDIDLTNKSAKEIYVNEDTKFNENNEWCFSSVEDVKNNLRTTLYPENNTFFIKGKVEETLPDKNIQKIALLRLDTDWYESTKHELETLYDKLQIGGLLIIDDYGHWAGAKKAVDEFIKTNNISLFLNRVDYTCRIAIKTK